MKVELSRTQQAVKDAMNQVGGNQMAACRLLKMHRSTLRSHLRTIRRKEKSRQEVIRKQDAEIEMPLEEVDGEAVWQRRMEAYEQRRQFEESRKLIPITIRDRRPIGLHVFGDPHVDDDGTDLFALDAHTDLILRTDGLYAANAGDTTNNWIGRLSRLYADQGTSASEAWAMAEHWIRRLDGKWLFLIGGNHDLWSGAGDPLRWICRASKSLYADSQVRMEFRFPNKVKLTVNARHDFAGKSQWNPAHGSMKAAQMGYHDDILLNGHKHTSGYGLIKCPATGIISHCIQIASYKVYDRFSREKGFPDQHISPAATLILNPHAGHRAEYVKVFWDPYEAAEFLVYLRARHE